MADPSDLTSQIQNAAGGPAAASGDAGSVTQQPLAALKDADQYLAQKAARSTKRRGVMFNKLIPAGPMSDSQGTGLGGTNFSSPGGLL